MNRRSSQALRLNQLTAQFADLGASQHILTPSGGWLKAVRQALGLSLAAVGKRVGVTPQAIHKLEKSESAGTICLRQFEAVARAMGCKAVIALLPREGTIVELAESRHAEGRRAVEHSMGLEGQAPIRALPKLPPK